MVTRLSAFGACVLAVAASLAGPGALATTSTRARGPVVWSQVGFDATRQAFNPVETTLDTSNVDRLTEVWSTALLTSPTSDLVVSNGKIFFSSASQTSSQFTNLHALNARNGHRLWSTGGCGPPVSMGDKVVTWA